MQLRLSYLQVEMDPERIIDLGLQVCIRNAAQVKGSKRKATKNE